MNDQDLQFAETYQAQFDPEYIAWAERYENTKEVVNEQG